MLFMAPIIVIFLLARRTFVEGVEPAVAGAGALRAMQDTGR